MATKTKQNPKEDARAVFEAERKQYRKDLEGALMSVKIAEKLGAKVSEAVDKLGQNVLSVRQLREEICLTIAEARWNVKTKGGQRDWSGNSAAYIEWRKKYLDSAIEALPESIRAEVNSTLRNYVSDAVKLYARGKLGADEARKALKLAGMTYATREEKRNGTGDSADNGRAGNGANRQNKQGDRPTEEQFNSTDASPSMLKSGLSATAPKEKRISYPEAFSNVLNALFAIRENLTPDTWEKLSKGDKDAVTLHYGECVRMLDSLGGTIGTDISEIMADLSAREAVTA